MKKNQIRTTIALALITAIVLLPEQSRGAGIYGIIKAGITKVIKAVDLKIQRQQNKVIWLQNAQKELENAMSKLKLREISDWTEKQREQYDGYFKELWRVKNAITTYKKVREIMARQLQLVDEYGRAWKLLKSDKHFTRQELVYMEGVYTGMLEESLKNLDQLMLVTGTLKTQMSDGERLELISSADSDMERTLADLRNFSDRNFRLSVVRSQDLEEAVRLRKLYGLN